jgi:carbon-monoxide dehydrogenase medium subunit
MFPSPFEYHRAATIPEAIALLTQYGDDAKVLAGGHSLLPVMKLRFATPSHLVDIARIPGLAGVTADGASIRVGAATRHADVAASPLVMLQLPMLAEAAGNIGDPLVRNVGTIGGSLAHADPSADLPAVVLALGATLVATGPSGARDIPADAFFTDVFTTALRPDELLTEVRFPAGATGRGGAYEKNPDPASGYAIVGIGAQLEVSGGSIRSARIAMTGLGPKAMRLTATEARLVGQGATPDTMEAAAASAADGIVFVDDSRDSAAYKANLARVYTRRALTRALARATAA